MYIPSVVLGWSLRKLRHFESNLALSALQITWMTFFSLFLNIKMHQIGFKSHFWCILMCNSTNCFRRQLQRQQLQLTCSLRKKSYQCNYFLSKDLGTRKVCFQIEKVFDIVLQRADWIGVFCIRSVTSRIQKYVSTMD